MGMIINRRRTYWGSKILPYDAEIEYLESTGTQWIDTGYKDNSNANEMVFDFDVEGKEDIIGNVGREFYINGTKIVGIANGVTAFAYYKPTTTRILISVPTQTGNRYNIVTTYSKTNSTFTIDVEGTQQSGAYSGISSNINYTMLNRGNDVANFKGKIYSGKIYEDGELVRDFIPVRVGNVGYMYDKVSKQLFGNSGTGAFILGSDK